MNATPDVTSGGPRRSSGDATVVGLLILLAPVGVAVQVSINAMSLAADPAAGGEAMPARLAWMLELSSGAAIVVLLPAIWWAAGRLRPEKVGWPLSLAGHAAASVAFSLAHVALMTAMRRLLLGAVQGIVPTTQALLYEYRKDAWSYALLACILASARWMRDAARKAPPPSDRPAATFEIHDGARRHLLPTDEIEYVEAAGNYVEVVAGGQRLLHRASLARTAESLGCGFVRVHRSRIVNLGRVRLIENTPSGDFDLVTVSGFRVRASRRFRADFDAGMSR